MHSTITNTTRPAALPSPHPRSPSATSARSTARATARSSRSTGSASSSRRARSPPSWARRGRARARSCTWRRGWTGPPPARVALGGHRAGAAQRAAADDPAARAGRVRLPGLQPDAVAHRRPEHRRCRCASTAAARGARRCARSRRGSGWTSACATVPRSSPAASSSGSRSPGRSSPGPRSCSPTSRPARWTPAPGAACSRSCARSSTRDGHTVVMVTHDPVAAAHADRVILLADGRIAGMLEAPSADEVAEQLAHLGELTDAPSRSPQRPRPPRHVHRRPGGAVRLVGARDGRRHAVRVGAAHPPARRALRRHRGGRDRAADRRRGPRRPARRARPRELRARRPAGGRPRRPRRDRRRVGAGPARRPRHRRPRLGQRRADALRADRRARARRARRGRHRLPRQARRAAAPRVHRGRPHRHRGRRRPARATRSGSGRRSS